MSGTFYCLGGPDPAAELRAFTAEYLRIFGEEFARAMAGAVEVHTPDRLRRALAEAEAAGCDEFILVPGTVALSCLDETTAALSG